MGEVYMFTAAYKGMEEYLPEWSTLLKSVDGSKT